MKLHAEPFLTLLTQCPGSLCGFLKSRSYFPCLQNSEAATSMPMWIRPVYPAFSIATRNNSKPATVESSLSIKHQGHRVKVKGIILIIGYLLPSSLYKLLNVGKFYQDHGHLRSRSFPVQIVNGFIWRWAFDIKYLLLL